MGRRDAVAFTLECVKAWRALGAVVTLEPGFETRGNGQQADYEGGTLHHTASPSSATRPFPTRTVLLNGRPDLSGPLCNVAGPWCPPERPLLHVIAAHPANHAGASGGRSMGPLPTTTTFNKRVFGLEIDYAGVTPMAAGQARAMLIFTAGLTQVLGRPTTEWVRGHAETSRTGKWDPGYARDKTIDLTAVRRDALALTTGGDDDMTPEQARQLALVPLLVSQLVTGQDLAKWGWPTFPGGTGETLTVVDFLRRLNVQVEELHRRLGTVETGKVATGPATLTDADLDRIAVRVVALIGRKTST